MYCAALTGISGNGNGNGNSAGNGNGNGNSAGNGNEAGNGNSINVGDVTLPDVELPDIDLSPSIKSVFRHCREGNFTNMSVVWLDHLSERLDFGSIEMSSRSFSSCDYIEPIHLITMHAHSIYYRQFCQFAATCVFLVSLPQPTLFWLLLAQR